METEKFAQLTTKKLQALIGIASEEDKEAIRAELEAREEGLPEKALDLPEKALDLPEKALETHGVRSRITNDERTALAEELKANINHRCQVVPFNTAEWTGGYIVGVIEEKRSNKILYAIRTDEGKRIVKVHNSNLLRIFDEMVKPEVRERFKRGRPVKKGKRVEWTPEMIAAEVNAVIGNVGKLVRFEKYRTIDTETGAERVEYNEGRIVNIISDKKGQRLFYRIQVFNPTADNPDAFKLMHKVITANLEMADSFDAEGARINSRYRKRREVAIAHTPVTPQDRFVQCEEALKKAEEKLEKVTGEVRARRVQLEEARAELDKWLEGQCESTQEAATNGVWDDPLA